MIHDDLTSDNIPLSEPTSQSERSAFAVNCNERIPIAVDPEVLRFLEAATSANTRRAYRTDVAHFIAWGGRIPATDTTLATYLAAHAGSLRVSTLVRRLTSISKAHHANGFDNPARSPLVRATLQGIKRRHGSAQTQAKPLLKDDLFAVLAATGDNIRDVRDRALLLVGFAGGFRRSELVALDREDVESVRRGIIIHVRRSKTDQAGMGRQVAIPFGRSKWCPVTAIEAWLASAMIDAGPLFRPIDRYGRVGKTRLSGEAVSLIVKERVAVAGLKADGYSGHSLRAGLATSAAQAGVSAAKIRRQTGHKSDLSLARYIRDGELFTENAAGVLL